MQAALLIALAAALTVAQADFISKRIATENNRTICALKSKEDCGRQGSAAAMGGIPDTETAATDIAGH